MFEDSFSEGTVYPLRALFAVAAIAAILATLVR
jgi:hypothetical protein